jgi:UDP-N-acetylmuramyl pentapeptide phosphotransferase/UDP-N-acetylglucosamine-1-phosphate transferase
VLPAAAARLAYAALHRRPPGGKRTWTRVNHRGEPVTLLQGPAVTAGLVVAALTAPGLAPSARAALAVAGAGSAAFGCYDDLCGSGDKRGFRGHLGALRAGKLTSGVVKLAGIGCCGLLASRLLASGDEAGPADVLLGAGLIAGGANVMNLFDLRPGRAVKVALGSGAVLAAASADGRRAVAGPLAAAVALLPEDLAERAMLGDSGANALGAVLGAAAALAMPRTARIATCSGIVALTAASEVVSFSSVIDRTGPLRWLDRLGRRQDSPSPVAVPAQRGSAAE